MIRFVDLRGQGCEGRFAWYDTVTSAFISFAGQQTFDDWDDFVPGHLFEYGGKESPSRELSRFQSLAPDWAFEEDEEER